MQGHADAASQTDATADLAPATAQPVMVTTSTQVTAAEEGAAQVEELRTHVSMLQAELLRAVEALEAHEEQAAAQHERAAAAATEADAATAARIEAIGMAADAAVGAARCACSPAAVKGVYKGWDAALGVGGCEGKGCVGT